MFFLKPNLGKPLVWITSQPLFGKINFHTLLLKLSKLAFEERVCTYNHWLKSNIIPVAKKTIGVFPFSLLLQRFIKTYSKQNLLHIKPILRNNQNAKHKLEANRFLLTIADSQQFLCFVSEHHKYEILLCSCCFQSNRVYTYRKFSADRNYSERKVFFLRKRKIFCS